MTGVSNMGKGIGFVRDMALLIVTRPDKLAVCGWWWLVGKRLRARYRLEAAIAALPFASPRWMADAGKDDRRTIGLLSHAVKRPSIGVHLHIPYGTSEPLIRASIDSVCRQSVIAQVILVTVEDPADGRKLEHDTAVTLVTGTFASRTHGLLAALEAALGMQLQYLMPLPHGAQLPRQALAAYTAHLMRRDGENQLPALVYGDELLGVERRHASEAWLKPEWDTRMVWSQDYITGACLVAVDPALEIVADAGGAVPVSVYAWILRMTSRRPSLAVEHVARITVQVPAASWQEGGSGRLADVAQAAPPGTSVKPGPFGTVRMQYPFPQPAPKVSIIVATRDRVELLRTCVQGVLEETDYPDFELIVVDNDSRDPGTLRYLDEIADEPRVQVARWPHPFNYSAINNFGAGHASGEYLCLLNNDIEVLEPQWLSEMMREAVQPGIGAVGARLLYPDRSIQHAGVAIGLGNAAGHVHRGVLEGEPGYFAQALIPRGASAVTAACLLVAKKHFDAVGGLDEEHLAVAYNDVDLCLKLRKSGLANIYTPAATLIHHESKSRGLDFDPENLDRYLGELATLQERWDTACVVDRWHHPRLHRASEKFIF